MKIGAEVTPTTREAPASDDRVALVSNALEGPPDEGTRKLAREIAAAIGQKGITVSVDASAPVTVRKLLWGGPLKELRGRVRAVVYVPTQSLTLGTYVRVQALKRTIGCRVVLIAPQARSPLPLERRWGRFAGPDVLLSPSVDVVEHATSCGIDARFLALGVDDATFRPVPPADKAELRARHGMPGGKVVLHVGHASPNRNLGWLVAARAELGVEVVVVVGRSQGVDAETITLLKRAGAHVFSDFVPDVAEVYAAADCYAFPVTNETGVIGTPLSVLEAMACNLPVVSTPFGGLRALFQPGDGLFFESDMGSWIAALARALEMPAEAVRTRELVAAHSWKSVADRVVEVAAGATGRGRR